MSKERWIVVNRWGDFQHYKDRRPVWIKLHLDLLDQDAFLELSPVRRSVLLGLWQIYARARGEVRLDTRSLSGQLRLRVRADDIDSLVRAGFIRLVASKTLAKRSYSASAHARPRPRAEGEAEGEKEELPGSGSPTSLDSRNGTAENDFEKELEVQRLLKVVTDKDDKSADTFRFYARQLPVGSIAKVRESAAGKQARYACGALKKELAEKRAREEQAAL